jgi:hypothetical protein
MSKILYNTVTYTHSSSSFVSKHNTNVTGSSLIKNHLFIHFLTKCLGAR